MSELVDRMIVRNLDIDVLVRHDLVVVELAIVLGEPRHQCQEELALGRRLHGVKKSVALHLYCCGHKLLLQ